MNAPASPQPSGRLDEASKRLDVRWMGATVVVPDHVMHRAFPAETVVLNLKTGIYHGLNRTAGRILEALAEMSSVADVTRMLAEEYDQPISRVQAEVCHLCQNLFDRELIERVSQR